MSSPTASSDSLSLPSSVTQADSEYNQEEPASPFESTPLPKPPLPPPKNLVPTQLPTMTQLVNITEFTGTQDDPIQPTEFLKNINCSLMSSGVILTDEQKITAVGLWLKLDSPAEEWFNNAATPKDKYADFEQSFRKQFPNIEKMKKTKLAEIRIKVEDLGKTEKYRGKDVYTHVVFAEKVLNLEKQAKIETMTTLGLFTLRDHLPEVLREKVPENQADWTSFVNAIKSVELGHIREGERRHKERAAEAERTQSQFKVLEQHIASNMALLNLPTKAIRDQFSRTTISQTMPSGADPFSTSTGGQGNIFNTSARHPAIVAQTGMTQPCNLEEEIKTIKDSITLYPIQPATDKGQAAYHEQMHTWFKRNGDTFLTKNTGFPLHPGGAQPGSGECFRCGETGHHKGACQSKKMISKYEGNFQAICGSILSLCRQPLQVNLVAMEMEEFPWAYGRGSSYRQQGNGEGPPAY